jgi:putative ABC transport system ATP-binding protein
VLAVPDATTGRAVLRATLRAHRAAVARSGLLAAGHQAGEALVPVIIGVVIDDALANRDGYALLRWIGVLAAVFVLLSTSFKVAARIGARTAERAAHELRLRLTDRVLDPRGGADADRPTGELVSIATEDARRVGRLGEVLPFGVAALTGLAVGATALLRISVPLGLIVVVAAPPALWLGYVLSRPLERRSGSEQVLIARASALATDLVTGLRVLKGLGAEAAAVRRYRVTSRNSLAAILRAAAAEAGHAGAMTAVTGLFLAGVALAAGRLAAADTITVGQLVTAVGLGLFLLGPMSVLSWVNGEFAQARASAARVAAVLSAAPATPGGTAAAPGTGVLEVPVLGLTVPPGELLGVVSAAPAALLRLFGDLAGVRVAGTDLGDVPATAARELLLVAAHDADLFEESIADNVRAAGAAPDAVRRALIAADADEVCRTLPDGADTVLAEHGRSLSGGQRQRVALARALAADPPVLVLHDPTTAVDAVTEARIADRLRAARAGRTTVVVTTSPALLAATDRVVVLDGDRVRVEGTHHELIGDAGYRDLVLG